MKKPSKKRKVSRKEEPREKIPFTHSQYECLCACARRYNKTNGTRLSVDQVLEMVSMEVLDHPVKSFICGSVEGQDQLAPGDLLPVPVQFNNTRQDYIASQGLASSQPA